MTAPRYTVVLRDGRRVDAVDVEPLPCGWLRACTIRTRIDYDEGEDIGRRVFDRVVVRRFPPTQLREVVELATEVDQHERLDPVPELYHSAGSVAFP